MSRVSYSEAEPSGHSVEFGSDSRVGALNLKGSRPASKGDIPGLTEIRGIAAIAVVFSHIDQFHKQLNIDSVGIAKTGIADFAVTIFFVLSGFLITYLLLNEKAKHKGIGIKKFYLRRVFRIWPAYYATIFVSLTLMGIGILAAPSISKLTLGLGTMVLLAPNLGYVFNLTFAGTSPLWSIGVEEQFYLVWPWVVDKTNRLLNAIVIIIVIYILAKFSVYFLDPNGGLYALIKLTRVDCMAIGGLFSLSIFHHKKTFLKAFFHPVAQLLSIFILVSPFLFQVKLFGHFEIEIYALASAVWISNTGFNQSSIISIKSELFRFLGEISYGVYVYHLIIIYLVGKYNPFSGMLFSYIFVLFFSILVAYISFHTLENYFLKKKKRFETASS